MYRRVIWSPVEVEYLKKHKADKIDQLTIALAKSRSAVKNKLKELETGIPVTQKRGKQSKIGKRKDLGIFVRSGWEANMMRLLKSNKLDYKFIGYEPKTFSFTEWEKPRGQALSYTPDFKVKIGKETYWIEVKGNWLRPADKTKLRRFKKHYPEDFKKLIAVVGSLNTKTAAFFQELGVPKSRILEYNKLKKKYSGEIPHWE